MAATSLFRTQPHLTNSTLSGMECFGGQLIVSTPPAAVLCTRRPRYHAFPLSANTAVGQLPSGRSAPLRSSILPPLGYPNLCLPGTRDVGRMIIVFSSKAPPKPSTLLYGFARRLTLPSTCLWTLFGMGFPTSLWKSLSFRSPLPPSCPYLWEGNRQSPTKPSEPLLSRYSSPTG